jgi:hypothetical protein
MPNKLKLARVYCYALGVLATTTVNLVHAQDRQQLASVEAVVQADTVNDIETVSYLLDQAELDQMLAPIALYPDSVLSHVLVASTYPLEVIQADRWRQKHLDLDEQEAINAVADKDWDPSVKALVPFNDLLQQITEDLNWLQDLGDAFLINEEQVLASIQSLRQKAYAQGSLSNNQYIEVIEDDDDIVIAPTNREVIYIPYYDTRVVYGAWWWNSHPPRYWHHPAHYYWSAGLYWSPRIYFGYTHHFGGFHWRNRHIVVNHYSTRRHHNYDDGVRRVRTHEYQRWQHNPHHRRGVRYSQHTPTRVYREHNDRGANLVRNHEGQRGQSGQNRIERTHRPAQVRQHDADRQQVIQQTQKKLNNKIVQRDIAERPNRQPQQRQRNADRTQRENRNLRREVSQQSRNSVVTRTPTDRGATRTPTDRGTTRTPTDLGVTRTPTDRGATRTPTDRGATRTPTEQVRQTAPTQNTRQSRPQVSRSSGHRSGPNKNSSSRVRTNKGGQKQH